MNNEQSARIKALLEKYKQGTCTPQEEQRVEQWLKNLNNDLADSPVNEHAVLKNIRRRVLVQIRAGRDTKVISLIPLLRIAAVLLLIPAAFYLYAALNKQPLQKLSYAAARGERKTLILPDSTEVVLNSSSVLTLSADFNETGRRVSLTGEAYFHVKHNAAKPFIITTGHMQTRVLGTQFNVHAYKNDNDYRVAVVGGRVQVSEAVAGKVKPLAGVLTRNLMITYNVLNHTASVRHTDADQVSAWQNGKLYFDEASVSEMAEALSRKYNIDIKVHDKPGQVCRYTVGFNNQPLNSVLKVLSRLAGFTYQYNKNKIIIDSPNCH
ncbi:FecR domain-containing protein [Mucilaginibacter sp. SMC90]|uniref:FecR family protein n=1 Tax=Mucilaginibacter sp. SMC90 TaxID=2929803 RepID=UPI001FB3E8B0|nr:FecR family protein [Mucilaginibacter sp. SMC90]UOE50626.1 FecR domain-containing protein [Mucilaginibacter sp. SMC90]